MSIQSRIDRMLSPAPWQVRPVLPVRLAAAVFEMALAPALLLAALVARAVRWRRNRPMPLVFFGTMHVNNWTEVARGLRLQGFEADVIAWDPPAHEKGRIPYDMVVSLRYGWIYRSTALVYLFQFPFFVWVSLRYDCLIMGFLNRLLDRTVLLRWLELPLLKLAGCRILLNPYGVDLQTPFATHGHKKETTILDGYKTDAAYGAVDEPAIAANRAHCQRWADVIISAIDHLEYLDRVDEVFHLRCLDMARFTPVYEPGNAAPVIVHATVHPGLKGTEALKAAVEKLHAEGVACELNLLFKKPHAEVLEAVANADIVADQFLLGAYARFAMEAMALGKPVLCHLREDLAARNPIWAQCPIVRTSLDQVTPRLRELLAMPPQERAAIGRAGRAYVEAHHSLESVGGRLAGIIRRLYHLSDLSL